MLFINFILSAIVISLSGVMAPGPITAATVGKGNKSPHAGVFISVGHGIVEFPLMIAVYFGFGYLLNLNYVKEIIGFCGGMFLIVMGISMLMSLKATSNVSVKSSHSALISGIVLSAGNPYFLIWWATVGAALILKSAEFGITGVAIFMLVHWLCDFIWFYFLSVLSFKGGHFFGLMFQKVLFVICGMFLIVFGVNFIIDAIVLTV